MMVRLLKGASGNLYEVGSDGCHLALGQLRDVLDQLGFKVAKKAARETTLRAYPTSFAKYPLLNPRFEPDAEDLDSRLNTECLNVTVLSKGDDGSLDRQLRAFPSDGTCAFVPVGIAVSGYNCHGHFVVPLRFSGEPGNEEINWGVLGTGLSGMLRHLRQSPLAAPKEWAMPEPPGAV